MNKVLLTFVVAIGALVQATARAEAVSSEAAASIQTFCRGKWTTGQTLNQRMFDHCVEEQSESQGQVEAFRKEHAQDNWFKDFVVQGCDERWNKNGPQPEMVLFCYKRELEGFTELKYQTTLASYNSGCSEACFKVWKSQPGTVFAKTFECYRKRSEAPNFALPKSLGLLLNSNGPQTETAETSKVTPFPN